MLSGNEYIKKKREERFKSVNQGAKAAGDMSRSQLGDIEEARKGGLNPSNETIRNICNGWGMPHEFMYICMLFGRYNMEDLVGFRETHINQSPLKKLSVYQYVAAGSFEEMIRTESVDTIQTAVKDEKAFALKIKGQSMAPVFKEGQIIIVSPGTKYKDGDYVVVIDSKTKVGTFKRYSKLSKDIYLLKALNEAYQDIIMDKRFYKNYKIEGVVVETVTKYR